MHKKALRTIAKMGWMVAVIVCLTGFLGHRNQRAILRTDIVDGVKLRRFETPLHQSLLDSRNVDLLSSYDDVRNVYGMRIHVATLSLLGPKGKLVCHFQTYQAEHEISWRPHSDDNIDIVANYLVDDHLPFTVLLHSVVTDTRANGAGKKTYLRRQLKKSYSGLKQAGILARENGTFRLSGGYQRNPDVAADYESWRSFNDRFVKTRDMGDEIVFRLSPKQPSISFHPSSVNRFNAIQETVTFNTRTFVEALVRAQLDLDSSAVERIPRGLTLPIVKLLRANPLPCHDL